MYDELLKKIRHCATDPMHCLSCGEDKDGRCFKRLMTQAADAIEDLSKQFDNMNEANIALYGALPKWIPVSEKIPDEYTTILFITGGGELRVGYYDGDHKSYCDMTGFRYMCTHWMPAPQPPEEK